MCLAVWKIICFSIFLNKKEEEFILCWIMLWWQHGNENTMCCDDMQESLYSSVDGMTTVLALTPDFNQLSFQQNSLDWRGGKATDRVRLKGEWMLNLTDFVGVEDTHRKQKKNFLWTPGVLEGKSWRTGKRIYRSYVGDVGLMLLIRT